MYVSSDAFAEYSGPDLNTLTKLSRDDFKSNGNKQDERLPVATRRIDIENDSTVMKTPIFVTYEEKERLEMRKNILKNEIKQQNIKMREIFQQFDYALENNPSSTQVLEQEMNRRFLLEAAVMQRSYTVYPRYVLMCYFILLYRTRISFLQLITYFRK